MTTLLICKENCEKILERELAFTGARPLMRGRGWVLAEGLSPRTDLCFAHLCLQDPLPLEAASVNMMADTALDRFLAHLGAKRIEAPWPYAFLAGAQENLQHRSGTVEKQFLERLRKKMSRLAKLARPEMSGEGLFVYLTATGTGYIAFNAHSCGQKRMQMDAAAPSRSYLKLEEAFSILGRAPNADESVVDLGAAPGGWSYSALKRGAHVVAVDNGPLKEPVRSHPNMEHRREDALSFWPAERVDWLFCDMLEQPEIVLDLLRRWLEHKKCRRFVVNLKIQRSDPLPLIKKIRSREGIGSFCRKLLIRQLYHDREEITLMGELLA